MAGYEAGGWQGAVAGGLVGGVVGFVAPQWSAAAADFVGGGIAGMFAGAGATVALGAGAGAGATVMGNGLYNATRSRCEKAKSWNDDILYGTALGAMAPLMSGEAYIVGAGEEAVGATTSNVFSVLTGSIAAVGTALDPEASHGFRSPSESGCGCQ
ncbi:hypothetical protein [Xanthomonas albilineans]|uniref:hypothetical protein n=1 Tax=Xanthomonas albilineans TaxID=29447 RepID=UPI0012D42212|nr:hypothetical protein [Xanthomonas albilineans]